MTDPINPAPRSPRRVRIAVIASVAAAAAAAAAVTIMITISGSSPARPPTAAQAARDRGIATGRALDAASRSAQIVSHPLLRLGVLAQPEDVTGLAGLRYGYLGLQLSATGTQLAPRAFASAAAESAALTSGRLDAAYLTPLAAIQAWQNTGGKIRVIAGAADRGTTTVSVLVVTTGYLASHARQVEELLKGHIQAATMLAADPNAGHTAAAAELASLTHAKTPLSHAATSLQSVRATCDPGRASVLTQATAAAAAGQLRSGDSPAGIFQLGPLNQLLRTAGQAPVAN